MHAVSRATLIGIVLAMAACGGSPPAAPAPSAATGDGAVLLHAGPGEGASLGSITWHLDQLAPAPGDRSSPPALLAVLRATTDGPATRLHAAAVSVVDDAGGRWSALPTPVYVPIDGLDGAPLEPAHGAAGVVAFRLPAGRRGVAVSIAGAGGRVVLDAPR